MAELGSSFTDADRLSFAEKVVRKNFKGLSKLPFVVQGGKGEGFAEFFPADEKFNPNPGRATIQVRRFDLPQNELEMIILGDALHLLPSQSPKFNALKQGFVKSMRPSQLEVARDMFLKNPSNRSFGEFLNDVVADAFIRDFVFQKTGNIPGGKPFVDGVGPVMGAFFEDQVPILERMFSLAKTGE